MTQSQQPDTNPATDAEMADVLGSAKATEGDQAAQEPSATEESVAPKPSGVKPTPAPKPSLAGPSTVKPVASVAPKHSTSVAEASKFAEVSDEGHVTLVDGDEKVLVGQVPESSSEEAIAYFARKYDDAFSQLLLLEQRLSTDVLTQDLEKTLKPLEQTIAERVMVGDMAALRAKRDALKQALVLRREEEKLAREKAIADQQAAREKIVEQAEKIAAQDAEKTQWKQSSQRMNQLFEDWKTTQKAGPRLPRAVEDELWARFRTARNTFDKGRRAFFSQLDARTAEATKVKEKLIKRAEELQTSTDWGPTSAKFRVLMTEWKAAPRAFRKEDDALWARFRAAQDVFFNARQAANDQLDEEFAQNLKVKEQILADGEKLLPFNDIEKARKDMQELRGRWEDAGRVPRKDVSRMDAGFRKLEAALQKAEDDHWSRTNPETQARTSSALTQLEETIAGLEADLQKAQAEGDDKAVSKAEEALQARRAWLEVLQANSDN